MRKLLLVAAAATAFSTTPLMAQPGSDNPTATHDNPSSCLGAERATRNSNGGDRAQGAFGEAQAAFVQELLEGGTRTYGEFLREWMAQCTNPPGGVGNPED